VERFEDFAPRKGDSQSPQALMEENMESGALQGQRTNVQLNCAAVRGGQVQGIESLAGSSDGRIHRKKLEGTQCVRKEDIAAGLDLRQRQTLDQRDRIPLFGQMAGGGTTGGTGANDDDIAAD
jgi:hypothetical protein